MAKKKQLKSRKKAKKAVKKPFWQEAPFLVGVAILALTTISFIPSLDNGFVNWDDNVNLLENPNMGAFDWHSIKGIFTSTVIGGYNPLPIFTLAIENAIFGMEDAFIYHLDNLILHLVCVFLVYRIGFQLGLNIWGSALLALLFGFHPMRVESVAWVTERKDVLFGAFYFWAFFIYLKYLVGKRKEQRLFYLTLLVFFIALFAKIQAVALPLALLAADYYFDRPLKIKLVLEKWLFFVMSLAVGLIGIFLLKESGTIGEDPTEYSFFQRILVGFYSYVVYCIKWIYPYEMSALYPYEKVLSWPFYVAPFVVIALFGGLFMAYRAGKKVLVFGFAFFTFNVMFMLQVLGAGQGFIADRFTYVPYFGLFFIMAYYFQYLLKSRPQWKMPLLGGVGAYLLLFGVMTWKQNDVWTNGETLWTQAIKVNAKNSSVWNFRGNYYRDNGQALKALDDYGEAIRLSPNNASLYNSRGKAYFELSRHAEALNDYNQAVALDKKDMSEFYANRGAALGALKRYDEALVDLAQAISMDPEEKNAYKNRLVLLYELGRFQEALPDHDAFLAIDPYDGDIWFSKALTHRQLGDEQSALTALNQAINLKPNQPAFLFERAKVNANLGNKPQALQDAQRARQFGMQIDESIMNQFR